MGFISRRLVPRSVRRVVHPVRTLKNAVTPRPIKAVKNPVGTAAYRATRKR